MRFGRRSLVRDFVSLDIGELSNMVLSRVMDLIQIWALYDRVSL